MLKKFLIGGFVLAAWAPLHAGADVYAAMGLNKGKVLSGTQLTAKVVPGEDKQIVCLATYLTGKKTQSNAVNVELGVLQQTASGLVPVFSRDYGASYDGLVGDGNLMLLDLDRDSVQEIIVSFDSYRDPLIEQRLGEIILYGDNGFHVGWAGPMEYDATRAARTISPQRRDHFLREIDLSNTLRTGGVTLFFKKTMIAVAGERLPEPKIVDETFPLRPRPTFR